MAAKKRSTPSIQPLLWWKGGGHSRGWSMLWPPAIRVLVSPVEGTALDRAVIGRTNRGTGHYHMLIGDQDSSRRNDYLWPRAGAQEVGHHLLGQPTLGTTTSHPQRQE